MFLPVSMEGMAAIQVDIPLTTLLSHRMYKSDMNALREEVGPILK